jgi:hypothetical protein
MNPFGFAEPGSAGQCGQHLRRGHDRPPLLELDEVIERDARQLGYLLAA